MDTMFDTVRIRCGVESAGLHRARTVQRWLERLHVLRLPDSYGGRGGVHLSVWPFVANRQFVQLVGLLAGNVQAVRVVEV